MNFWAETGELWLWLLCCCQWYESVKIVPQYVHCAGVRWGWVRLYCNITPPAQHSPGPRQAQPSPDRNAEPICRCRCHISRHWLGTTMQCSLWWEGPRYCVQALHKNICLWFMCPFLPNFVLMLHLKMLYPTHIHWKIVVIENCHQKQHESICMTSNTVVNQSVFHVFIVFIVSTPMRIVYIITNSYWDDWWCCHICVVCAVDNEMIQSLARQI